MKIEEFYTAIRHKFEPETLSEESEEALTYGTRRYVKLFKTKEHRSLFISRNIPAMIFGSGWFAFRRMYLHAFILFIIGSIATITLYEYVIGDYIAYIINVVVGLFGNALYFQNVKRRGLKGYRSEGSIKSCLIYLAIQTMITLAIAFGLVYMGLLRLY
jgi:hypothetical protein